MLYFVFGKHTSLFSVSQSSTSYYYVYYFARHWNMAFAGRYSSSIYCSGGVQRIIDLSLSQLDRYHGRPIIK